jgi:alkylation response protein AidB-like acyl-CoA dehydrogenase
VQETQGDRAEAALLERRQYGHQIGDFQAPKRRLDDKLIEVKQARSMVMRGLAAPVDSDVLDRAIAAAAKAPVQLRGIGVTKEHLASHPFDPARGGAVAEIKGRKVLEMVTAARQSQASTWTDDTEN